jgi:hypothetical protein
MRRLGISFLVAITVPVSVNPSAINSLTSSGVVQYLPMWMLYSYGALSLSLVRDVYKQTTAEVLAQKWLSALPHKKGKNTYML